MSIITNHVLYEEQKLTVDWLIHQYYS